MATALVLSAGGMFAAWEAGVWKSLSHRFKPDLIVGASAGAWNEWMDSATARIGLFVVEVPRLGARLVRDSEITWRHLAATCTTPFGLPPVRIQGRRYVYGGLLGALPLWAAQEMGATRAIAVNALTTLPFRVIRIEPSTELGSVRDAVCWSRPNVERWIEQGQRDANRVVTSITM